MVGFLLQRPIAVMMTFLGLVILGIASFFALPVSLLPEMDIPEIIVRVDNTDLTAREVEDNVISPLRRELMQLKGLNDIRSESANGFGIIHMKMDYGVDVDLSYIEANEKIDRAMNNFPKSAGRPEVIKKSVSDIPVCYLQVYSDSIGNYTGVNEIVAQLRRRLEQLPQISLVDVTGNSRKEISVVPDVEKLRSLGLDVKDVEDALVANNTDLGNITVRDGYYEYQLDIANQLIDVEDVRKTQLLKNGRIYGIGSLCSVESKDVEGIGKSMYNGIPSVCMAVIKNNTAGIWDFDKALDKIIREFQNRYPAVKIDKTRDQSMFLKYTVGNLELNLILGLVLVFMVCWIFMKNWRLAFVVGLSVIVAVIITMLLFFLFARGFNIISLAGLILAVGMMIDNSVIVVENILRHYRCKETLFQSCIGGTNEMITPLLSGSLTTVAVFLPLVFVSGIAGAMFEDQAFAITAGLVVSYITGITFLPVLLFIFGRKLGIKQCAEESEATLWIMRFYERGYSLVFNHKGICVALTLLILVSVYPLWCVLDKKRLPEIDSTETLVAIDWNENIDISENQNRTKKILDGLPVNETSAMLGPQQFMLGDLGKQQNSQTQLYLRASSPVALKGLQNELKSRISVNYPQATMEILPSENPFEQIFVNDKPDLEARIGLKNTVANISDRIALVKDSIEYLTNSKVKEIPFDRSYRMEINEEKALLYGTSREDLNQWLKKLTKGSAVTSLQGSLEYTPVMVRFNGESSIDMINDNFINLQDRNSDNNLSYSIPLKELVEFKSSNSLKRITASAYGEYIPYVFTEPDNHEEYIIDKVKSLTSFGDIGDIKFDGSFFDNREMMAELTIVLAISLVLMYFILCAQFSSTVQPLVVLIEIPLDLTFAFFTLWICGQSLNLMSGIGIIVSCGIVVNDSILKVDSINNLRKEGKALCEAIHIAGKRRLKPIVMTSLTTIFAMVPVLFTSDIGSELQRPLAIAVIGSMVFGTIISLYIVPLFYYLIYRRKDTIPS